MIIEGDDHGICVPRFDCWDVSGAVLLDEFHDVSNHLEYSMSRERLIFR